MAASHPVVCTEQLYECYSRQVYSFCLYRLGDRAEAEDAVQSTFLNAFRGLERGVVPYSEGAWLFKIAQNVCMTFRRSSFRRRRVETPIPIDDTLASPEHETEAVFDLAG